VPGRVWTGRACSQLLRGRFLLFYPLLYVVSFLYSLSQKNRSHSRFSFF
jgi:hypothetical protein